MRRDHPTVTVDAPLGAQFKSLSTFLRQRVQQQAAAQPESVTDGLELVAQTRHTGTQHRVALSTKVVVFFAMRPDEALLVRDVAVKFGAKIEAARTALRPSVACGLLEYGPLVPGRKQPMCFRAGRALLELIGEVPRETVPAE